MIKFLNEGYILIPIVGLVITTCFSFFLKDWSSLIFFIIGIISIYISKPLEDGWIKTILEWPYYVIFVFPALYSMVCFRVAFGDGIVDFFKEFRVRKRWLLYALILCSGAIYSSIAFNLNGELTIKEDLITANISAFSWCMIYFRASKRFRRRDKLEKVKFERRKMYDSRQIDDQKKIGLINDLTDKIKNNDNNIAENLFMRGEVYLSGFGFREYLEEAFKDFENVTRILTQEDNLLNQQENKFLELSYARMGEILFDKADKKGAIENYAKAAKIAEKEKIYLEEIEQIRLYGIVYPFEHEYF
ncbi:MAG: hypothetical protein R2824_15995 [Saprospiraceae bacterium]